MVPSGITAAPSNLACRFVAIRGRFVQDGLEGNLGAYLGGLHVHVEAQEVRFGGFWAYPLTLESFVGGFWRSILGLWKPIWVTSK